jgi:hypothetical protein
VRIPILRQKKEDARGEKKNRQIMSEQGIDEDVSRAIYQKLSFDV